MFSWAWIDGGESGSDLRRVLERIPALDVDERLL
jgi:hypothetical protein